MNGSITVIILTHNEEIHIARALESVSSFASSVYIIDSGSTDNTVEIAKQHGANVISRPWKHYADQMQWAFDNVDTDADWFMRLDADEIIEPDLAKQIKDELPKLGYDIVGIKLHLKRIYMNRWIKHGGIYPLTLLRIFRRGHGRIEQRWMDEHIIVEGGKTVHFAGGFADHNLNDLTFFTEKHNKYATREAIDVLNQRYQFLGENEDLSVDSGSKQAAIKRWIKEKIYNKLPFGLSTLSYFLFRYFLQLGFLDGREGLIYHFLQGYWYRFLVGAKTVELEKAIKGMNNKSQIRAKLSRLTGLDLTLDE